MTIKNKKLITLLVILEIVAITAIFELGVRIYAAFIVKRQKIHRPDSVCGWRTLPNLNMQRLDPDGRPWQLITDERGVRGPSSWTSDNRKRILILGDCFVLGDGVNLLKRFDRRIAALEPTWDIIALGGLGYGTDQELLLGKEYFGLLRSGDICIFNTYINDFSDILRKSFEGRAKPWFTLSGGILTEHPPVIGAKEILREKSYIFSKIVELFEKDERKFSYGFCGEHEPLLSYPYYRNKGSAG